MEVPVFIKKVEIDTISTFADSDANDMQILDSSPNIYIKLKPLYTLSQREIRISYSFDGGSYTFLDEYNDLAPYYTIPLTNYVNDEIINIYIKLEDIMGENVELGYEIITKITRKCVKQTEYVHVGENIPHYSYKLNNVLYLNNIDIVGIKSIQDIKFKIPNTTAYAAYTVVPFDIYDKYCFI